MKFRLFALNGCSKCEAIMNAFRDAKILLYYVDAEADESQDLCDRYNVDEVPHIQIMDNQDRVLYEHVGFIDPSEIFKIASALEKRTRR